MKISDVKNVPSNMSGVSTTIEAQTETGQGFSFTRHMMDFSQAQYQKYIEDLKDRVFKQGETIKKEADIKEYMKYRKLIAELLEVVASNAYTCSRTSAIDNRGRRNVFVLIRKVNSRLDEMAQQLLSQQSDNINLLDMVDDIRGLLVDILL